MTAASVPNTSCSVMRYRLVARLLQLLHGVIKEEINQNGVHLGLGMLSDYLSSQQLDAPNATT